jgi:O-methyltransferase
MSWKDALNLAMHRTTGFMLTRETPDQRDVAVRTARRQAAAHARKRERRKHRAAKRRESQAARRTEGARLPGAYDEELRTTVGRVRERTMTGPEKLASLVEATRYIVRHQIPGAVVECGVWRGGSMQAVAFTLLSLGDVERDLHLFDTFEGMPPPTADDTRKTEDGVVSAEQLLATSDKESRMWAIAGLDDVRQAMSETGYPAEKVHYHPGLVEETTPGQAPDKIAILRLDTDWYSSTKHELEHLYERLSPGGVLILDDYGDWDGARKATDEWLTKTGESLFLAPMGSGRIAVKPPAPMP